MHANVILAHGGGGRLMHQLIEQVFMRAFGDPALAVRHDGAVVDSDSTRVAISTDSYVVNPLFFPGGDIGSLAVHGTVNDLAMCGARPLYLSAGFILEEGLPLETLRRIADSMRRAAEAAGVRIVTGDTKVVAKGQGDGVFINTTGLGAIEHSLLIGPQSVRDGDIILLSGDIGRHGMAIMAVREGLAFESEIESDSASVADVVIDLIASGIRIHCLRDLTRGGLASALVEIAETAGIGVHIKEDAIPVRADVRGACEILGFDPLHVANEGRFIALVPPDTADRALGIMRKHAVSAGSCPIGVATSAHPGSVTMRSLIGVDRIVDMLSGEQLPRIC